MDERSMTDQFRYEIARRGRCRNEKKREGLTRSKTVLVLLFDEFPDGECMLEYEV